MKQGVRYKNIRIMTRLENACMDFKALLAGMQQGTCLEGIGEGVMVVGGWAVEHLVVEEKSILWGG